mmetsp:Transcript_27998/g.56541  ORF Transcript_27998/g.56541 Transcript_27998/m.56541 type:complete len:200 (-) Transcript_27998:102-701(-)
MTTINTNTSTFPLPPSPLRLKPLILRRILLPAIRARIMLRQPSHGTCLVKDVSAQRQPNDGITGSKYFGANGTGVALFWSYLDSARRVDVILLLLMQWSLFCGLYIFRFCVIRQFFQHSCWHNISRCVRSFPSRNGTSRRPSNQPLTIFPTNHHHRYVQTKFLRFPFRILHDVGPYLRLTPRRSPIADDDSHTQRSLLF